MSKVRTVVVWAAILVVLFVLLLKASDYGADKVDRYNACRNDPTCQEG